MIFRQITHDDLGCASYLVGDAPDGVAAVIDPRLDVELYLELAAYLGVRIEHVLETHNHADHVSGHGRLVAATGAQMHIHREAGAAYQHEPFDDGWELELGRVRIRALHTPGHRPEHTSFALIDTARGPEPWAVLTGDSLFVGDVARPDLAIDKEEGARGIYRSLGAKLLGLPPETEIWPGHLGGSMCGGPGMDMKVSSTIGYERRHNDLLADGGEQSFVDRLTASLAPQPPNFRAIVEINRGPLISGSRAPEPLTPYELEERAARGALVVDVRSSTEFDGAHVPGSVSVPTATSGFGTQLAWIAGSDQDVLLVAPDHGEALRATGLAASVGVERVRGYLAGGLAAWRADERPVGQIERIEVPELYRRLQVGDDLQLLDVRERGEWEEGHIPGSVNTPYHDLDSLPEGLEPGRPVAVLCASGQRAAVGASLVSRHGAKEAIHVVNGGVPRWERSGWPIERGEPTLRS